MKRIEYEEGFCPETGINKGLCYCSKCRPDFVGTRKVAVDRFMDHGTLNIQVTPEDLERHKSSGKIVYRDISDKMKIGHYRNPERGYLAGLQVEGSRWLRQSRQELSKTKAHIIWALRRKKINQGGSVFYLHGPAPDLVRLTGDEKDIFEDLNRAMPNPNVNNLLTNPERISPYTSVRVGPRHRRIAQNVDKMSTIPPDPFRLERAVIAYLRSKS